MRRDIRAVWIDTGGTFTDCIALDQAGVLYREKVLSTSALRGSVESVVSPSDIRIRASWGGTPSEVIEGFGFRLLDSSDADLGNASVSISPDASQTVARYDPTESILSLAQPLPANIREGTPFEIRSPEEAPILATRLVTGTAVGSRLPSLSMRLATTRGTNALLERSGAPTVLFTTRGFGDLLLIGDQQRPELFELHIRKPPPMYDAVVEVPERIAADGSVLDPIDLAAIEGHISAVVGAGIRSAAVALLHSHVDPSHEHELAAHLSASGFDHVSCSSDLSPFIKIVPRAETAVVDAYLSPVIDDYLARVRAPLGGGGLHVMTSAGGMMQPGSYHAKDSLLSGPAGGVVGAALAGTHSGCRKVIAFDMGGTSTDVARFDGDYDYVFEHRVGDAHLVAPALAIESVAAGGGSVCRFDGSELHVGPESAGARPGPACYGAGGPLTLTDVNLLLGRLDGTRFDIPIDAGAARRAQEAVLQAIEAGGRARPGSESLLEGFCEIANERMADAIRRISIRKGYDPADYALVAFGGAGGQHACAVARLLGTGTIVIPEDVSLLSAVGLGHASIERFAEHQLLARLDDVRVDIPGLIGRLSGEAAAALEREGVPRDQIEIRRRIVNLRFVGQDSVLQVEYNEHTPLETAFETKYRAIFGHWQEDRAVEIESIRTVASSKVRCAEGERSDAAEVLPFEPPVARRVRAWFDGEWQDVPAYERDELPPGARFEGPSLVHERYSVTVVESGWTGEVDGAGALVLRSSDRSPGGSAAKPSHAHPELVRLELFTNRFRAIAREMGEMLGRTAMSTNVKERLDFSCAVLDGAGELVVNAPHIPVHLGAMGLCVRTLRETLEMAPGDVVVTNHPGFGGSHLPDVTVVTPVHLDDGRLLGYVANRAHHAEIGGARPGSMPSAATGLGEEGVVIAPMRLFGGEVARWEEIRRVLTGARYPTRAIDENLADLAAAVAANRGGAAALRKLARESGADTVVHYMGALKRRAEEKLRDALRSIKDGVYEAEEALDDGSPLCVRITIDGDGAAVDFTGSAGVHPGNLNATPAVVNGAVIYVLRLLVAEPLPLNEGLMHAIRLIIPPGILNPPFPADPERAPAVVGGNVETSQRLVDTMLKALGLAACSQGTMNNVLFGTQRYSYYETVCGGAGAGPDFDGADAVHTHMTNTRITDPEIVEHRYPVRVDRFGVRRGSGGSGRRRGGDGAVRELTFLEEMTVSVLGQHRRQGPYGLEGGARGQPARQLIVRPDGTETELDSIDGCDVSPGDRLILETPGGGGFGVPPGASGNP
jgi:5-oxoprolinase (ATP-hydrolysing)